MSPIPEYQFWTLLRAIYDTPELYGGVKDVPNFDGTTLEEWQNWKSTFLKTVELHLWPDWKKKKVIHLALRGSAFGKVKDLFYSSTLKTLDCDTLLQYLDQRFAAPAPPPWKKLSRFRQARQHPEESITHWYHRIRDMYAKAYDCYDTDVSVTLKDQFVFGLYDEDTMTFVINSKPPGPPQAYKLATSYVAPIPQPPVKNPRQRPQEQPRYPKMANTLWTAASPDGPIPLPRFPSSQTKKKAGNTVGPEKKKRKWVDNPLYEPSQ